MPLVTVPGEPLCGYTGPFGAGGCLTDLEQIKVNCLRDRGIAAKLDIASVPEIIQVCPLCDQ